MAVKVTQQDVTVQVSTAPQVAVLINENKRATNDVIDEFNSLVTGADDETIVVDGKTIPSWNKTIKDRFDQLQAMVSGLIPYNTLAEAQTAGEPPLEEGYHKQYRVLDDPTSSNNGIWYWNGTSLEKSPYDPFNEFEGRLETAEAYTALATKTVNQYLDSFIPTTSRVYQAGTIDTPRTLTSTFDGWAAPFDYDGSSFDAIKVYYTIENPGKNVRLRILSGDLSTVHAEVIQPSSATGHSWFVLNEVIDSSTISPGVIYYVIDTVDAGNRIIPHNVSGFTNVADPVTYPQRYSTNIIPNDDVSIWTEVTQQVFPPALELYNISTLSPDYTSLASLKDGTGIPSLQTNISTVSDHAVAVAEWRDAVDVTATTSYDSINSVNTVSGTSGFARPLPFTGWGSDFNTLGSSFNAIRVQNLARTSTSETDKWSKLIVEVRDGSCPTGTIIAKSELPVDTELDTLSALVFHLTTPQGVATTLSSTDFPSGLMGVTCRAENSAGDGAACGECRGNVSSFAGASWYNQGDGIWRGYVGDTPQAFEFVSLVGLTVTKTYSHTDRFITDSEVVQLQSDVTALQGIETAFNEAIDSTTVVRYDSTTPVNTVSSVTNFARPLPFAGWGSDFNPVVGTINAIKIRSISRTSTAEADKWSKLIVDIRDGSCPTGTVLASAELPVDPESNVLTDLIFILKDTEGAFVNFTQASFTSGTMGATFRAENSTGGLAACGEVIGTVSNHAGLSWYTGNGTDWSTYTQNTPQALEFLTLNNLRNETSYSHSELFEEDANVAALDVRMNNVEAQAERSTDIISHDKLYAVVGEQTNYYFDNVITESDVEWDVIAGEGEHLEECYRTTPTTSGETDFTVNTYHKITSAELGTKTVTLRKAATGAATGVTRKFVTIGDSTTAGGQYVSETVNLFSSDAMNVSAIGTLGVNPNNHEGRGGWSVASYLSSGPTYYKFNVTGVTTPPNINSTRYTTGGSEYKVQEVELTGGNGFFIASVVSGGAPPNSGTLTKSFGVGDDTVTYTSTETVPGNPFWNGTSFDFSHYMTDNGFNMGVDDWVFIHLGINDVFSSTDDSSAETRATTSLDGMQTMINSIKSYNSGIRIGVASVIPPAGCQSSFSANYGAGQSRWRYKRNIMLFNKALIQRFGNSEASNIYILPFQNVVDSMTGFPMSTVAKNSRTTETVTRGTNAVHPNTSGYNQMADQLYAMIKYHG